MGEGFGEPDIPAGRLQAFPELLELQPTPEPAGQAVQLDIEPVIVEVPPLLLQATPGPSNPKDNLPPLRRMRRRRLRPATEILRIEKKKQIFEGILNELKILNQTFKKIADK